MHTIVAAQAEHRTAWRAALPVWLAGDAPPVRDPASPAVGGGFITQRCWEDRACTAKSDVARPGRHRPSKDAACRGVRRDAATSNAARRGVALDRETCTRLHGSACGDVGTLQPRGSASAQPGGVSRRCAVARRHVPCTPGSAASAGWWAATLDADWRTSYSPQRTTNQARTARIRAKSNQPPPGIARSASRGRTRSPHRSHPTKHHDCQHDHEHDCDKCNEWCNDCEYCDHDSSDVFEKTDDRISYPTRCTRDYRSHCSARAMSQSCREYATDCRKHRIDDAYGAVRGKKDDCTSSRRNNDPY
jgi:hypothetical protein